MRSYIRLGLRALIVVAPVLIVSFAVYPARPALGQTPSFSPLRVEDLSVYALPNDTSREINISFRIVNRGSDPSRPARTTISPGATGVRGLESLQVPVPPLLPNQTLYVSRNVELPVGGAPPEIRVEVAAVTSNVPGNFVATVPFLGKPSPGEWVSIGPRRITAPGIPALGLGQYDATGRLTSVAVHPTNSKIIYAASVGELGHEGCGLWKTVNGGISWKPVAESLPTLAVAAIAIDPSNPERVYIATADNGIFRSEDGGVSWLNIEPLDLDVQRNTGIGDPTVLLIDPVDPSVLYLTTNSGVRRSRDGGMTWPISRFGRATSLVMDPYDHHVLYAGIQNEGVDKGVVDPATQVITWTQETFPIASYSPTLGILLAISRPNPTAPATLYALLGAPIAGRKGWTLFTKTEGGDWFARNRCSVPGDVGDTCARNILAVDPANPQTVYLAGPQLSISQNAGVNFTQVPSTGKEDRQPDGPHGDYHGWSFDPSDPSIVYAATDGGAYRSTEGGKEGSWAFIGEGITNAEIYDIAGAATPPRRLFAGTQDNGTMLYSGSVIWDHVFPAQPTQFAPCAGCGGDGALVDIDIVHPDTFYLMVQLQDSLTQTPDVGVTFNGFASGLPTPPGTRCGAYNSRFHFEVHPASPTTLLASCIDLWRTTTNAPPGNWQKILPIPTATGFIVRSAIDASIDLYYAATGRDDTGAGGGTVYAGPGGSNFVEIFQHPQGESISDLELDPERPDTLYAAFAQSYRLDRSCDTLTTGRIFQLTRLSAAPTAQSTRAVDITGDLPLGLCVNTVAIDPTGPLTVYVGTQKGVYRGRPPAKVFRGGTWSWTPYNKGLPLADVRDLEFHPSVRIMFAATYGRGAFEMFTPASKAPKQ